MKRWEILQGDVRETLRALETGSVQTCVTSPPYFGLRDYGVSGQIGLEPTPAEYVEQMVAVFREVRRVLRDDGTLWLNLGDSYTGSVASTGGGKETTAGKRSLPNKRAEGLKPKDLIGIPGASPSRCRPTAGICARTSSGTNRTRCLSRCAIAAPRRTSTCSC